MAAQVARDRRAASARLLREHGRTYAAEAGITLRDTPSPLYRLLVLSLLCSTRISASIAVDAARELSRDGLRTARAMADADWQRIVDALGRAHYRRYDESTATALGKGAQLLLDRWGGDLRRLREDAAAAGGELVDAVAERLQEHPRIGPVGAAIFCREAQGVWPGLRPYFDAPTLRTARQLGLPGTPEELAELVDGPQELPRLAAALVRAGLEARHSAGRTERDGAGRTA